jgi:hypothetical protein
MRLGAGFVAIAACGAVTVPGCGGDSGGSKDSSAPIAATATNPNAKAIQEIAATRAGLDRAVEQLRGGDRDAAEDTVAETYLQHFELVEGPLDEVDHELNEELEETIKAKLRKAISSGAKPAEVRKLVDEIDAELDTAEEKLK